MLIVHAADVHLDAPLRGLRVHGETDERREEVLSEIRRASRRAFSNLVDLCERKEADLLLLAGDLFDTAVTDFNAVRFVHAELARLADITRVVIVKGNHDAQHVVERNLDDAAAPHVAIMNAKKPERRRYRFGDEEVVVTGQSYAQRHTPENLAAAFPPPEPGAFNIALLHTELSGGTGHAGGGHVPQATSGDYAPCQLEELVASGYDYWALGHVHTCRVYPGGGPLIAYPGSLQGRDARETGERGALLVRVEHGALVGAPVLWPLAAVQWEDLDVIAEPRDTPRDLYNRVRLRAGELRRRVDRDRAPRHPVVVRITITGETDAHDALLAEPDKARAAVAVCAEEAGLWIERVLLETRNARDYDAAREEVGGFLTALEETFDRVAGEAEALAPYLAGDPTTLQAVIEKCALSGRANDAAHVRTLLGEARALVLARLGDAHAGRGDEASDDADDGTARDRAA